MNSAGLCIVCRTDIALPESDMCGFCAEELDEEKAYWERRRLLEEAERAQAVAEVAG